MPPYNRHDRFFKKAKQDNRVARSVYKLEEIDRRFQVFSKGQRLVDLGCSPGSWLQYLAQVVGPRGLVVGYDLEAPRVAAGPQVFTFQVDVHALTADRIRDDTRAALAERGAGPPGDELRFAALVSDMAPKLTGIRDADQARSIGLAEKALALSLELVEDGGAFIAKMFQGRDSDQLILSVRKCYGEVRVLRPEATREGSREAFIIAKAKKPD